MGPQIIGGIPVSGSGFQGGVDRYVTVDDVYSIVRKIVKACKKVPINAYAVKDKKQHLKYKAMKLASSSQGLLLEQKEKAFELLGEDDELNILLSSPNENETKDLFLEACYTMLLLTGERFLYLEKITEGANRGKVMHMHVLPSQTMSVISSNTFPESIKGYQITTPIVRNLTPESIVFSKYYNPQISGQQLRGLSPLSVASSLVQQAQAERDYSNTSLQNAGAYGALTLKNTETQRGEIVKAVEALGKMKADLWKEIGSLWSNGKNLNARKIGMITGDWQYLNFGISPSDMDIVNQNKVTFKKLCNIYGVSDVLFNNDSASTESNVKQMMNHFFENAVIPEVENLVQALNKAVVVPGKTYEMDLTDLSEMQEDTNSIVKRFADAPVFKPNDFFDAMGYGKSTDTLAEQLYIKAGYSLLEDIGNPFSENE